MRRFFRNLKKGFRNFILIIIGGLLLAVVLIAVLQFRKTSEDIIITTGEEQKEEQVKFDNESNMGLEEVKKLLNEKRDEFINFFLTINYYKISEFDKTATLEDDEKYFVLDSEFVESLKSYVTERMADELISPLKYLAEHEGTKYFKAVNTIYDDILYNTALVSYNYNKLSINPTYANDNLIISEVHAQYCKDEKYKICESDKNYLFEIQKDEDVWRINRISKDRLNLEKVEVENSEEEKEEIDD